MGIALVTGASRGIGKATALQLAREGYTVAVNYHHNIKAATDVINQIVEAGGKAFAVRADISDEAQVLAMFESLDREGEPLSALVNNAGILFEQSTIENLSAERINRVQGGGGFADNGAVAGGGGAGHSRQLRPSGPDLYRYSCFRRRTGASGSRESVAADAARRPAGRGRPGDCLAAERKGVVRDGEFY